MAFAQTYGMADNVTIPTGEWEREGKSNVIVNGVLEIFFEPP